MFTGQISSHALHVVHAQSSAEVTRWNTESASIVMSRSTPTGGETCGSPVAAMTSPTLRTISRGSSGLPVACAGHTDVHRPQIVHASVSKSCFQVKSSTVDAPNVSSSVSMRLGSGLIAPFGRSRSARYMFIGDVIMWRSFVVGRITRNAMNAAKCTIHIVRVQVGVASPSPSRAPRTAGRAGSRRATSARTTACPLPRAAAPR